MKRILKSLLLTACFLLTINAKERCPNFQCGLLFSARPCVSDKELHCSSPFACASFVYWQTKLGGLEYAAKNIRSKMPFPGVTNLNFEIFIPDFNWNPGFKVRLGYHLGVYGMDVQAKWTYAQGGFTNIKKHFVSTIVVPGEGVIPLWFFQFLRDVTPSPRYEHANGSWKMHFNSADLEWGRNTCIKPKLKARPFAGLKIAWNNQTYKVEYNRGNQITANGTSFQLLNSNFVMKNNSTGVGPRVGLNSRWNLLWGFSLIGDGAFSLIYDYFRIIRDQTDLLLNNNTASLESRSARLKEKLSAIKPFLEFSLGIDWGICFCLCQRKSYLGFSIAYDMHYWWGQNQLRRLVNTVSPGDTFVNNGDMQLHGLTASARFDF